MVRQVVSMDVSRNRLFFISVFIFSGVLWGAQQATPARQTTPTPQTANATTQPARGKITGAVTSASSGQPVRKASVTLMPAGNQGNQGNRGQNGFGGQFNQPGQPAVQPGQTSAQQGAQAQPGQAQRGGQNGQQS